MLKSSWRYVIVLTLLASTALIAQTQPSLTPDLQKQIDDAARTVLAKTGVSSASIAIVQDGRIAYLQAYGDAKLQPKTAATPQMRYSIGSISKQFTATAVLLLQEQGKLSLDDKVSKYIPDLTRANEITIRQLLSHTSGYQDYWPQDYVPPFMLEPVTAQQIMNRWAKKPLDFDPGTKWQYSNTNYVIAGAIIEKVSGMPMMRFLQERIFRPLGMKSVMSVDDGKLTEADPIGYLRYALGSQRLAPKEGRGWLFAAGELAMTAEDLAKWNVAEIEGKVMSPASYREFGREVLLTSGVGTQYGLGISVSSRNGVRIWSHGGGVSGFTTSNEVYPDERASVVVLTNQDSGLASGELVRKIGAIVLTKADPEKARKTKQARAIFEGLQQGKIDRSLFTENANAYFTEQAVKDFASSLAPLGTPESFEQGAQVLRGGMLFRAYQAKFPTRTLRVSTYEMPDGKVEQFMVATAPE